MSKDKNGTTRGFIKGAIILWIIAILTYLVLNYIGNNGAFDGPKHSYLLIHQFSSILLIFGVFGIPILLGLAIFLRSFEKIIDKIAARFHKD